MDDESYLGLTAEQARTLAEQDGESVRLISQGSLYRTNLVPTRLNLVVAGDGTVMRTWRG